VTIQTFWGEEVAVMLHHQISEHKAVGHRGWLRRLLFATALACGIVGLTAQSAFAATTVALWHMNEKKGSVMHDSARHHNGTLFNVTLGVPGFRGSTAYGFNGSSSYVSVPSARDLNPGRRSLAVTIHLKTTNVPGKGIVWTLIRKGHWATKGGEWKIKYNHRGQVACGFRGSSGRFASVTVKTALNNGKWHTIRCLKTSSKISITVDKKTRSRKAKVGKIANHSPVVLGAYPNGGFFNGSLDEAKIAIG
jgi:hypothetical protein